MEKYFIDYGKVENIKILKNALDRNRFNDVDIEKSLKQFNDNKKCKKSHMDYMDSTDFLGFRHFMDVIGCGGCLDYLGFREPTEFINLPLFEKDNPYNKDEYVGVAKLELKVKNDKVYYSVEKVDRITSILEGRTWGSLSEYEKECLLRYCKANEFRESVLNLNYGLSINYSLVESEFIINEDSILYNLY